MGNREGNILKQIYPPFSPLVPIPLAHNSSFLPITRLPTFFPSKTPQGILDEAVVGRKNGTCTFFRSSPLDARPSDHRIASFTIFFSPLPKLPFLICVPPRFTLHLEPFLASFYATIPLTTLPFYAILHRSTRCSPRRTSRRE